ncbi:MAG: tetratricopeptide repeat protein [Verrucomicrobiia bacterium]
MKAWVLILLLAALPAVKAAREASAEFDQANREFERGDYSAAIAGYQKLIEQNQASAAVFFNLGNAHFRAGNAGQAIVGYLLAQRLSPRDPDIRANLRFARESVSGGGTRPMSRWERLLNMLTLNQLAWITAGSLWTWLLWLAAGQVRPEWVKAFKPYLTSLGIATAMAGLWLALLVNARLSTPTAVVITREAIVRYGPFEEAQSSHSLRDGAELAVLDRKDNWLQVMDGARRTGWLHAEEVAVLPRG